MKKFKYKDKEGNIHELKDIFPFTGVIDRFGNEVYEGDTIQSPAGYRSGKRKYKNDYWDHKVVVMGGRNGKTVDGTPIYDPFKFKAIEIERPQNSKRYSWNWSSFFDCIKIKDRKGKRNKAFPKFWSEDIK